MMTEWNMPGIKEGKLTKRWFGDSFFDLFVWLDEKGAIVSFQLCYGKPRLQQSTSDSLALFLRPLQAEELPPGASMLLTPFAAAKRGKISSVICSTVDGRTAVRIETEAEVV